MKTVYLIRHAKSSWSNPSLTDFERPLNERGHNDVAMMAEKLSNKIGSIDCLRSSTAVRAEATTKVITGPLGVDVNEITYDEKLYHASSNKLLKTIASTSKQHNSVAIVAHNPGLTELANQFANVTIDNVPTTGVLAVNFEIDNWEDIFETKGKLVFFDYPKLYKSKKAFK